MKITVIDGQGGRIGKTIVERLKDAHPMQELYAIGTNSLATAAMLKAGADYGATGENLISLSGQSASCLLILFWEKLPLLSPQQSVQARLIKSSSQ